MILRRTLQCLLPMISLAMLPCAVLAQAIPAGTLSAPYQGFQFPSLAGSLSYGVSVSETIATGYAGSGQTVESTNISGDVAYLSKSETHPFSMVYSGGFLGSTSEYQPSTTFQNLSVSQILKARRWTFIAMDTVNYLPQSPTAGLSGIPGLGDLGTTPASAIVDSGPGILTNYQRRVSNYASGSVQRGLTGKTSLQGSASYGIQRFLGAPLVSTYPYAGFDTDQMVASGGVSHRLDARSSVAANYSYSLFTYVGQGFSFDTNGVNLEYTRQWTPRLSIDASIGPQWTGSSSLTSKSLNLATAIGAAYIAERTSLSLSYSRGANNGSGVVPGALSDSLSFSARRGLNRAWQASAIVSYTHSSSIASLSIQNFSIDSEVASGQISRAIGRNLSAFGSYTIERQSTQGLTTSSSAFSGLSQIFGFGLTYSPRAHQFGK